MGNSHHKRVNKTVGSKTLMKIDSLDFKNSQNYLLKHGTNHKFVNNGTLQINFVLCIILQNVLSNTKLVMNLK